MIEQVDHGPKGDPTVSVIIPAYNAAAFIHECLDSVMSQSFRDFEVIVINDGSPDTVELEAALVPFNGRITYLKQSNSGPSGARNAGIRVAKGNYLAFIDSDDIWESNYLEVQVPMLEQDPQPVLVYPNALIFGAGPHVGKEYMDICPSEGEASFESLVRMRCNVMVSCLARRDAVLRAGLFDESLLCSEDFDLWLRMAKQGGRIVYHRQVLVRYRNRPDSLSADSLRMYAHGLRVFSKCLEKLDLTSSEREALESQIASFSAMKDLIEGKKALETGEIGEAEDKLARANSFRPTRKLAVTLCLLRHAPRMMRHAYNIRRRYELRRYS